MVQRSRAQALCEAGAVSVNNTVARSSKTIRERDEITLRRGARTLTVRVLEAPPTKQVSRERAAQLYEVISDETCAEEEGEPLIGTDE